MNIGQRVSVAVVMAVVRIALLVFSFPLALIGQFVLESVLPPNNAYGPPTGLVLGIWLTWLAAALACQIPAAKSGCSVTAIAVAGALDAALLLLVPTVARNDDFRFGLSTAPFLAMIGLVHMAAVFVATFWRTSRLIRVAETYGALALWATFTLLTGLGVWIFAVPGHVDNRTYATALEVAALPLLVALVRAFWRDGGAHVR